MTQFRGVVLPTTQSDGPIVVPYRGVEVRRTKLG